MICTNRLSGLCAIALLATSAARADLDTPVVAPAFADKLVVEPVAALAVQPAQLAWGPDRRLYMMTVSGGGVIRYDYDTRTGTVSNPRTVVPDVYGVGIAFHGTNMYISTFGGAIRKIRDNDGDGNWGEPGETNVAVVTGIPEGDHSINQLVVRGNTLYVGIGRRTINGRKGDLTAGSFSDTPGDNGFWGGGNGTSWGDCIYGGTIAWIKDLRTVANTEGSANAYADTTRTQAFIQTDDSPFQPQNVSRTDKLLIHSAGTRNPFGLCLDRDGNLFFTSNFNRTATNGDGTSGFGHSRDNAGPDFSRDVHDQAFRAIQGGDYGYADDNWRPTSPGYTGPGVLPFLDPLRPGYNRVTSLTFDNLFQNNNYVLHDPANPNGLGPHASANGCGFFFGAGMPPELAGDLFVTRFQDGVTEATGDGTTLSYSDVVAVDVTTGQVRRVVQGFRNPLCMLYDNAGRLLIADYATRASGSGGLYSLRPRITRLGMRTSLTRQGGEIVAQVFVTNSGDNGATGVALTQARLGTTAATTTLPLPVADVAPGGETPAVIVRFPAARFAPGSTTFLSLTARHSGGVFTIRRQVRIP